MKKLLTTTILALALVGCSSPSSSSDNTTSTTATTTTTTTTTQASTTATTAQNTFIIQVTKDGQPIEGSPFTFNFQEGDNLLDVMKANMTIVEKDGFVTAINGVEQEPANNKYWMFDVNSVLSPVVAKEVILKDGDVVDWKLEAYNQ